MLNKMDTKVSLLAGVGGMLGVYDFILYILFSDQISRVFFSAIQSEYLKQIIIIAIFSIAYVIRPLGGFIIGWMGDLMGRKKCFSFTIMLMGFCVFFMGVMPSYASIGISAPIIFILLRMTQGFALGGELPGAIIFVFESVKNKGVALGVMFSLVFIGFLLGDVMSLLLRYLFDDMAWRVAFISGSLIALIGYYIRRHLEETPLFTTLEKKNKYPFITLLKKQSLQLIACIGCVMMVAFNGVILSLYMPTYLEQHLQLANSFVESLFIISALTNVIVIFYASYLSNTINYYRLFKFSTLILVIICYPLFFLINTKIHIAIILGVLMLGIPPSICTGLFMRIICEAFINEVRFSGVAISYNLAFAIVGGVAPIISELVIHQISLVLGPVIPGILCGLLGFLSIVVLEKKALGTGKT